MDVLLDLASEFLDGLHYLIGIGFLTEILLDFGKCVCCLLKILFHDGEFLLQLGIEWEEVLSDPVLAVLYLSLVHVDFGPLLIQSLHRVKLNVHQAVLYVLILTLKDLEFFLEVGDPDE